MDNSNLKNIDLHASLENDHSYDFLKSCEISAEISNGVKYHEVPLHGEEYSTMEEVIKEKKL